MILILKIGSPPLSEDEVMLYFILCTVHLSYNGLCILFTPCVMLHCLKI